MIRRIKCYCATWVLAFSFFVGAAAQDISSTIKRAGDGDPNAQFHLGLLYENGDGFSKNAVEAAKWYRKAAEQGHKYAQYNLAFMYANGENIPVDAAEVVKWMRLAANDGDADAQWQMGNLYASGQGVAQNDQEAVKWYRKAAQQGQAKAMFNLGDNYWLGKGVQESNSEAARWYHKAANQGFAPAQYALGVSYSTGEGVDKNDAEAVKWYRKAAEQGYAAAQYNLGLKIARGEGTLENLVEAYSWASLSASQGDSEGGELVNILNGLMTPEQIAEAQRLSAACQNSHYKACEQSAIKTTPEIKTYKNCASLNQSFTLYFGSESSELTPEAKAAINQVVDNVAFASRSYAEGDCAFLPVKVTGHTDLYGSDQKNQVLSSAMAHSVADYLSERHDISYENMALSAKGETEPAVVTSDNEKNAQNRRVTVAFEFGEN